MYKRTNELSDIEYKISYLMELKKDIDSSLKTNAKRKTQQRFILFFVSLSFLVSYYLNIRIKEFNFLGLKVININFDNLIFLSPVLMTFLFSYYIVIKKRGTLQSLRKENLLDCLDELTGIKRKTILNEIEFVNLNDTLYKFIDKDYFYKLGESTFRLINWIPFVYAYILSAYHGSRISINTTDIGFKYFYFITLFICVVIIVIMQISGSFSFRKGKVYKKKQFFLNIHQLDV